MKLLIKLLFYFWLAVLSMAAWFTGNDFLTGQIALALYCVLGFFGGLFGIVFTLFSVLYQEPAN